MLFFQPITSNNFYCNNYIVCKGYKKNSIKKFILFYNKGLNTIVVTGAAELRHTFSRLAPTAPVLNKERNYQAIISEFLS